MNANAEKSRRLLRLFMIPLLAVGLASCDPLGDDDDDSDDNAAVFGRIAGSSETGFVDGAHDVARFSNPVNVEVAADGRVYVADFDNDAIRVINSQGVVSTLLRPANVAPLTFARPFGLTITPDGTLYVQTDGNDTNMRDGNTGTIWRVNLTTGAASVVARNLGRPRGLLALDNNTLAMSDPAHHVISTLNLATGVETTLAGTADQAGFVNAAGGAARFNGPYGLARLPNGSLLVADSNNHRLREVTLAGVAGTFAGTGANTPVTNGPALGATFNFPQDVAVSGLNVYVADHNNFLIRRINGGTVFTQAGNGMRGFADGEGIAASFNGMEGIALDASGATLWIADGNNGESATQPHNRVRRLSVP